MTNGKRHSRLWVLAVATAVVSAGWIASAAAAGPAVPVVQWSPHAVYQGRQINVGPTGVRAWVDDNRIIVTHVAKGSPACGVLKPNDVLAGADRKLFKAGEDPRVAIGNAITAAETKAGGGKLHLCVKRAGKLSDMVVPIRVLGSYGPNWPYDCAKSARIVDEACAYLATRQYPDGSFPCEVGMATQWNGLLFLASGDAKYQDNARRCAQWLSDRTWEDASLNCWPSGYSAVMLAEYYLATGDRSVLPTLQKLVTFIGKSQMACGSWGHNGPWGGYGAVNQVGLVCLMAMVLGEQCGADVDQAALKRGLDFFQRYADKGWVPYGDHQPWMGQSGNGKSALAAEVFALKGGYGKAVSEFSDCVAGSYEYREQGHSGCYFSLMWGPMAARLAGEKQFRTFMDHQRWYYDLARDWEGGIFTQPNDENLSGRTPGTYTWSGPTYTTGGMTLVYCLPRKTLRILGAPRGVFDNGPDGPFAGGANKAIKELRDHWTHRERKAFDAGLAKMLKDKSLSAEQRTLVEQLAAAAKRQDESVKLTLAGMKNDIDEGDVYRASEKLASLEKLLGKDAPELADAQQFMADNDQWVEAGKEYWDAWAKMTKVKEQYWQYYGKKATDAMGDAHPIVPLDWSALVAKGSMTVKPDGKPAEATFNVAGSDIGRLRLQLMAGKGVRTKVYINGTLVATTLNGGRRGYEPVELSKKAIDLLKKDGNVLKVVAQAEGKAKIDVALEATKTR